jgi:hypothetical protein
MVLLAAYRIGAIDRQAIVTAYAANTFRDLLRPAEGDSSVYVPATGAAPPSPERGDIVIFGDFAHVALATGTGDQVLTFWPPTTDPDFPPPGRMMGTLDQVKQVGIVELATYMGLTTTHSVEYGPPDWPAWKRPTN